MPAKLPDAHRNNIIEKYNAGATIKDITSEFGVSNVTVFNILKRANIPLRGKVGATLPASDIVAAFTEGVTPGELATKYLVDNKVITTILRKAGITESRSKLHSAVVRDLAATSVTDADVVKIFESGIGVQGIHDKMGISIRVVIEILRRNGVDTRDRSAQQLARMARTSPADRIALAAAANASLRGVPAKQSRLIAGAATYERQGNRRRSVYEDALAAMLLERGVDTVPQKAFGPYNSDLAAAPVAVEVFGGKWHWYGTHLARCEKRTKFILNAGWHVLMVAVTDSFPLTPAVADYVAAYIDEARRNPSAAREYRVIWGAGEFSTAGGADDNHFSIKPPFTHARNATSGQYKRIPR